MHNIDLNNYLFLFLIINFLLFKNLGILSEKINIFDNPNYRKIHKKPVPVLGGTLLIFNILTFLTIFYIQEQLFYNKALIIGIILFFCLGISDDKKPIGSNNKLIISFFFLILILFIDNELVIQKLNFSFLKNEIGLRGFNNIFTILCFLLFINAFNMFDGINCQAALYSIFLILNLIFFYSFDFFLIVILIFLCVFIYYNYFGKIFLGDGGSLCFGFIFSYFFVKNYNLNNILYADEIFLLMLVPGVDMFRVYLQRLYNKQNPFLPDQSHLHHYLIKKFSLPKSLMIQFLIISLPLFFYKLSISLILCNLFGLLLYVFVLLFQLRGKIKC